MKQKTALILSGGMDSVALCWWQKPDMAITIDYGQKAALAEIEASTQICKILKLDHYILTVDCKSLGSGDMAGATADKYAPASDWWPYRNQLLITLAAMKAISLGAKRLLLGTVKNDSFHIDGTPEFIESISSLLRLQEGNLLVEAPSIMLTTHELIIRSKIPTEVLMLTHSCHKNIVPCNNCRGCNKHNEVLDLISEY